MGETRRLRTLAKPRWAWRVRSLADIRHAGLILLTGNTWSLVPIAV